MSLKTAMILAAGRGERMRPLTDNCPKPLLEVSGQPLISHHLRRLSQAGIEQVVINHAWKGEMIEQYLGYEQFGISIQYSAETTALETGGGILKALPLLGHQPFIVVNGDVWTDYPFQTLSLENNDLAHLVLIDNPAHNPAGDFVLTKGRVKNQGAQGLTFSGIGVYHPELFAECDAPIFPLAPLLRSAIDADQVSGEHFEGEWIDIGTPERLYNLRATLEEK